MPEPNHLGGEILDHYFLSNSSDANEATTVIIKNISFTDQDARKLITNNSLITNSVYVSCFFDYGKIVPCKT